MFEPKDFRQKAKEQNELGQEMRVAMRPILHSPAWDALERWARYELEELVEVLENPSEPFDMVRYHQGEIRRLRELLQLKSELLKSNP